LLDSELGPKRLELLHELVPKATVLALLVNPTARSANTQLSGIQAAARALGLQLHIFQASTEGDLDSALASMVELRPDALMTGVDGLFERRREQLAALALRHTLPAMFYRREFATAGGLMSYGGNILEGYRRVGVYVGRILKGEKPTDLPVVQPTKFDLVINLKTAKALGLTVPPTVFALATEVIE